jgi:histidine triad (HIT) family protein
MDNCRFCQIAQKKVQDYIIYEDEKFMAFLDANPAKPGHCMLIPKKHTDYFFDLEDELYLGLFKTAKKLSEPLRKAMGAKRIGIAVVGFDVPHAHLHLIPLHGSNELFDPKEFCKAKPDELKNVQEKLKPILGNL